MTKRPMPNFRQEAIDTGTELHELLTKSKAFTDRSMAGVLSGVTLYLVTLSRSMGLSVMAVHELVEAISHDFPDRDAAPDARDVVAGLMFLLSGVADMKARQGADKARPKPKADLPNAVKAADAEADRIIAEATKCPECGLSLAACGCPGATK